MTNPTNPQPKYNHLETEARWVAKWQESQIYKTPELNIGDKKKYILETFPYPSADGLHVGHTEGYSANDITARYARMNGFKVLYPMGWDAFGLPTENFAKKKGFHPQDVTNNSISNFRKQVMRLGASYDWNREINTSDPSYYKWTQWFFQLLYKRGLAYKKEALVNWDPIDKTVLANEQVLSDGTAERSGAKVEQKMMSQWFFKITDYAERLLEGLEGLDWPESTKEMQRNWIGKSEGAEINFQLDYDGEVITVFTTAHDTIYGATFLVIAPEHPLVERLTTIENKEQVDKYIKKSKTKSNLERTDLNKDKQGVFTGTYVHNPLTGMPKIPVWIADYVLTTYGTGAVMGVPGEDERDYEFATKYNLPIVYTNHTNQFVSYSKEIKPNKSKYTLINSNRFNAMTYEEARPKILADLIDSKDGQAVINYRLRDWSIGRQRYWGCPIPVMYKDGQAELISEQDLPLLLPQDLDLSTGMIKPLGQNLDFINSASYRYGEGYSYEGDTMDTFVCSSWYFFRYCSGNLGAEFASPEDLKTWMPIDQYIIGAEHSTMHLLYARFFTKVLFDEGLINFSEPFTKVRHQGLILGDDNNKMSKSKGNVVNPTEVYDQYGADTLRMYEMFMGPFDQPKPWSTSHIKGVRRFIDRVWNMQNLVVINPETTWGPSKEYAIEIPLNNLIKKISEDIESYSFNTAVAEFMKFVNIVDEVSGLLEDQFKRFLIVLAPFAPFITEEIWGQYNQGSIHTQQWPQVKTLSPLLIGEIKIVVQVNGKVRGEFSTTPNQPQDIVIARAKEVVAKWLVGKEIKFCKVIPNKLVTLVV